MGTLLVLLALGILIVDTWLWPWAPILLVVALAATGLACRELLDLLPSPRPRRWVCHLGVAALVISNWPPHVSSLGDPWLWVAGATAGFLMLAFLIEAAHFQGPSGAVLRLSLAFGVVGYLGLLACFFLQLRWLPGWHGSLALALAIFVPKCGDIGAYFTGRLLGRHPMAPVLSPKKTWEGAGGGLAASVAAAVGINALGLYFAPEGALLTWSSAIGFGVVVGIVAQLGDLAESLVKRDCERKDASVRIPGFGGVLDVLDSILFSAPVSYLWITRV